MAVVEYEKGNACRLSANFRVSEFACHGTGCCDRVLVDEDLVAFLQKMRDHFGKPVVINSGYRCGIHNRRVGGAAGSRHLLGQAADIAVQGVAPAEVAKFAESIGVLGIGLYETAADGYFVHVDTRPVKSFWYGQGQAHRASFGGYGLAQFRQELQAALSVGEDALLTAAPTLGEKWNRHHKAVKPVQKYLSALGYWEVGEADGVAGAKFAAAVAHFQRDQGCEDTGILEQWGVSWHRLLQSGEEAGL